MLCSFNWWFSFSFTAVVFSFLCICNDGKREKKRKRKPSVWKHCCPLSPHSILHILLTLPDDYSSQPPSLRSTSPAYSLFGRWGGIFVCCRSYRPPRESLRALEKHLRNPQISRTSSSHEGIYLAARKASLSVYEMLMWIASALLCGWEHRGPLLVVKPTCSVCFSMCGTPKPAKLE